MEGNSNYLWNADFTIAFVKDYILDISMFLAAVYFVCALVMVMRVKR